MQAVVLYRVAQAVRNDLLARNFIEALRPPFSGDYLIRHRELDCNSIRFRRAIARVKNAENKQPASTPVETGCLGNEQQNKKLNGSRLNRNTS